MNALVQLNTGGAVAGIIPQNIEEVFRLASAIHKSGLAPYGMDTPEKLTIAVMTGMEVGLPPMQAIQSIAVINNRPTIWGDGLLAVVRSSPLCCYVKEWIEGDGDARIAYCETLRKGESEPVKRSFSVDDAKRAKLWQTEARIQKRSKGGAGTYEADNDSPWYKYPQRMLQMRARAWCIRDTYPDLTKGMQVREEVEDYQGPERAKDITPPDLSAKLSAKPQGGFSQEHIDAETGEITERAPFVSGALTLQPPSDEFTITDFLAFMDAMASAETVEQVDEALPQGSGWDTHDFEIYRTVARAHRARINGKREPEEVTVFLDDLKAWVLA
jgi:hypothetical protein